MFNRISSKFDIWLNIINEDYCQRLTTHFQILFLEGGRLEKELTYTKETIGAGSDITNQIVIQTPKVGNNVLTQDSFKQHRDALVKASEITVSMFDM